jgi:hypothetical protein
MTRFLRYLRIAFSAMCLIACVLLIALWVRSYRKVDELHGRLWGQQSFLFGSKEAFVIGIVFDSKSLPNDWQWEFHSATVDDYDQSFHLEEPQGYGFIDSLGIGWYDHPTYKSPGEPFLIFMTQWWRATLNGVGVVCHYRWLVLITATSGVAPWIRKLKWRFSLRTLLIATTLVAVVLGLVVYAAS